MNGVRGDGGGQGQSFRTGVDSAFHLRLFDFVQDNAEERAGRLSFFVV